MFKHHFLGVKCDSLLCGDSKRLFSCVYLLWFLHIEGQNPHSTSEVSTCLSSEDILAGRHNIKTWMRLGFKVEICIGFRSGFGSGPGLCYCKSSQR